MLSERDLALKDLPKPPYIQMASKKVKNIRAPLHAKTPSAIPNTHTHASEQSRSRVCVFCGSSKGVSPTHLAAAHSLAEILHKHDMSLVYGGGTVGLMGEVARTLVFLQGRDAVEGVIPGIVMSSERPETKRNRPKEILDKADKHQERDKKGWWARKRYHGSGRATGHPALDKSRSEQSRIKTQINDQYGHVTITPDLAARKTHMVKAVASAGPGSGFVALSGGFGTMDEVMEVVTLYQHGAHRRRVAFLNVEGFYDHIGEWMEKAIEAGFVRPEIRNVVAIRDSAEGVIEWLKNGT